MTSTESSFQVLPEARCRELLAAHTAGRVAWNAPDGPHVLPVSYAIDVGRHRLPDLSIRGTRPTT